MIKLIYALFAGILIAVFIGVGISVFYEEPAWPEEPSFYKSSWEEKDLTAEQIAERDAWEAEDQAYQDDMKIYNRNVSIIGLAFAIVFLAIGITGLQKTEVLSNSLLLGGIFTLLYSMGRGLASGDDAFRFAMIAVSLAIVLGLGYWKFGRPQKTAKTE